MSIQYRVAFIGCGNRARQFADGLKTESRCQVVALSDPVQEAAAAMATNYGYKAETFTDHQKMLAKVKPDVVIGALWTVLHLPVFRDCAAAGVKSYLSEKPMAATWADSQEMARIAQQSGCQLTFCHQRRFQKRNRAVRKLFADGVFGKIERMDFYSPCSMLDCGTHTIDQALSYLGEIPAKRVLGAVDVAEVRQSFGAPVEGPATGLIVFENGLAASVVSNFRGASGMNNGLRLLGTKGMMEVHWGGEVRRAVLWDDPSWRFQDPGPDTGPEVMGAVVREVLDCLASGEESDIDYRKALRTTEIIFAFYESARRHAVIDLPLTVSDNPIAALQATCAKPAPETT